MNIVVAGGSGGIGAALVENLSRRPKVNKITATYNRTAPETDHPDVTWHQLDLTDETAVQDWAAQVGEIDWLINAVGILHNPAQGPEKTIRQIDPAFFLENISINTMPTLLLDKHLHSGFRHRRPAL